MGFTLEQQRAEPGHFLRTMADRCDRSTCGVLVMPNQVPEKHLTMLFAANCSVRVLVVERRNVTAEYDEFRRHSAHRHDDVKVSAEHYAKMHKEWFHTVGRVSERAKAHTHRLATEQLNEALWTSSPLDALSHPILTAVLANLLQRRTSAAQPQAVQSAVAAKVGDMHEHTSSYRERRRRNIVYSASAAFLVTCVAGLCLALGIALGERHARKLLLLRGEQAPQDERAAQSSLATPAQPGTSPDKPSTSPKRDRTGHAGTPHYTRVDSGDTPPNGGGGGLGSGGWGGGVAFDSGGGLGCGGWSGGVALDGGEIYPQIASPLAADRDLMSSSSATYSMVGAPILTNLPMVDEGGGDTNELDGVADLKEVLVELHTSEELEDLSDEEQALLVALRARLFQGGLSRVEIPAMAPTARA
jgi:hypothetical protein